MKYIISTLLPILLFCGYLVQGQSVNTQNAASKMISSDRNLTIGGYGEIDYNKPVGNNMIENGRLDVHRLVLLFGYKFNDRLNFVTEIEFEHVKEVYIEQAFLNYRVNTYLNLRGGLMLVPMGIINEYHEPTTFNGVERPVIDKLIVPTTWREIGLGATGVIPEITLRYQLYIMNGFNGYDGGPKLSGQYGLRKARQKGAESIMRSPSFAGRIEYFGLRGLNVGLSAYSGLTQSSLFKKIDKADNESIIHADSSVVGINMLGMDVRYGLSGFQLRAQLYYSMISNTLQYNYFTTVDNQTNDLGESMYGYYLEAGYNIFQSIKKLKSELILFARYSEYDTQYTINVDFNKNPDYHMQIITTGIGYKPISGVALKADIQFLSPESSSSWNKMFNAGIAVWF